MSTHDSFTELMHRLRGGDDEAAREVFQRYSRQLMALARRQFNERLAHKVDPEDVVQSAYKSFFLRHREGKLEVENWNNLWSLLTLLTLRKCADRVAYLRAQRRDTRREAQAADERAEPWREAIDREPQPEEAVVLAETLAELFGSLDVGERPVLELSLQGYSASEISEKLGWSQRSVRRLRERVRKRLERLHQPG